MIEEVSSKKFIPQIKQNYLYSLQKFSLLANDFLDDAEKNLSNLLETFNHVSSLKVQNIYSQTNEQNQNLGNTSRQNQSELKKDITNTDNHLFKGPQSPKYSLLIKKKQNLMQKLREVDRQMIKCKFQPITNRLLSKTIDKQQTSLNISDSKQSLKLNPIKNTTKFTNIKHDFDRIEQMNKKKIRQHEQLIRRMQIRQEEQIRKIQQIQQRRNKNNLNFQKSFVENKQNIQAFQLPQIKGNLL